MRENKNEIFEAIVRMKTYIASNLQDPITADDIAKAAGYSQFHAARIFKVGTGLSPFEYIRSKRLTSAAHALRQGNQKVMDIALDFVFDSHEGFTRAFANGFGILPKKFADHPPPEGWLIPRNYLNRSKSNMEVSNMNQTAIIFTQIMERPARKLILKKAATADDYFSYCEEVGCGINNDSAAWDILSEIKDALYEPVGLWLPENMRPAGTGVYAHGVEVPADYSGEIPDGFDVIDLEPCQLLVFQGEPYNDENFEDAIGICVERICKFNPEVYGYKFAPELAPRMQLKPWGWRGYIEMQPVVNV